MPSEQLQMVIDMLRAFPPSSTSSMQEARANLEALASGAPVPEGARCEAVLVAGVPCEWITGAGATAAGAILYLHGGGYVRGSINTHRAHIARLSSACGLRALAVDYRLGPEHVFPAALDDALTAYRWLVRQGTPPARLIIAGDSAGGGLTVATLVAIRAAGEPLPAGGVCLSPWADLECVAPSFASNESVDPMVTQADLRRMAAAYLGAAPPRTPLASPLYADLGGLPPLLVHVGRREILLDDATRLAERTRAAGGSATLEVWDDMIHVWHMFAPLLPEATAAVERVGAFVRATLG